MAGPVSSGQWAVRKDTLVFRLYFQSPLFFLPWEFNQKTGLERLTKGGVWRVCSRERRDSGVEVKSVSACVST